MNNMQSVLSFLKTRRSYPPALLTSPYPTKAELMEIAEIGLRVPDHKILEPWRLIIIQDEALRKLADLVAKFAPNFIQDEMKCEKMIRLYRDTGCVIAMVSAPVDEPQVPIWEQEASMGAVGLSLVNACCAKGFGATWVSGFLPESLEICQFLGLQADEKLRGLVHVGTPKSETKERPRPDINHKLTFL